MFKYFGRNDCILIAVLIFGAVAAALIFYISGSSGYLVNVYVDGRLTGEYLLSEDNNIIIQGYNGGVNTLVIKDGAAYMKEADCPDKLCIHQGRISREGMELVCMPNRVVVRISGKDKSEIDAFTQ
jgi:hypothetical protein